MKKEPYKSARYPNLTNKILNTYPNLIKDNLDIFFHRDSVPEDALDDYEVDKYSPYYMTVEELDENNITPEDLAEIKELNAKMILKELRAANKSCDEFDSQFRNPDGTFDVASATNFIFGDKD